MEAEVPKASSTTNSETLNSETEPNQPSTRLQNYQEEVISRRDEAPSTTNPEAPNSEAEPNQPSTHLQNSQEEEQENNRSDESKTSPFDQKEIVRALEVVERDSVAIAESFTSLFASLRLALSEVTSTSVDHMHCFSDAAGCLQESALDATTKGNRYINSCLRLNEEMKGVDSLAVQLKILRRNVDALDSAVILPLTPWCSTVWPHCKYQNCSKARGRLLRHIKTPINLLGAFRTTSVNLTKNLKPNHGDESVKSPDGLKQLKQWSGTSRCRGRWRLWRIQRDGLQYHPEVYLYTCWSTLRLNS
ncbi:hypothetical protein F0562_013226 [Nyssa sinensis]|uniref:BLOC-1-related complex subunit 6 C-terminal helix domain-containing protein n=1 Tax=Nyssa sinensis TaxID=561372 RepID=A0A5J4ZUD2_9ASTE|nr:hypothetical protein F0562_013226 [Nyssa sinensis]